MPLQPSALPGTFPIWVEAIWAIVIWGSLLGALLLLWRKRLAVGVYRVTLVAALIGTAYQSVLFARLGTTGQPVFLGTTTIIVVAAVGPFLYARTLHRRDMLH